MVIHCRISQKESAMHVSEVSMASAFLQFCSNNGIRLNAAVFTDCLEVFMYDII